MTRSKSIKLLASTAVIAPAAVPVAACGGGGGATGATPPKTTNRTAATVGVADTSVGKILVDSRGRSLYLFNADTMTKSARTAACAAAWPPLLAHGKPTVAGGAAASMLGTATRADGTQQMTYHGHPLYLFADDQNPGDVEGQGVTTFRAGWFVLSAACSQISAKPASRSGGGNSGGSSGY
jgi:predicted lipoprotein with Yx(FWY)xxD motif